MAIAKSHFRYASVHVSQVKQNKWCHTGQYTRNTQEDRGFMVSGKQGKKIEGNVWFNSQRHNFRSHSFVFFFFWERRAPFTQIQSLPLGCKHTTTPSVTHLWVCWCIFPHMFSQSFGTPLYSAVDTIFWPKCIGCHLTKYEFYLTFDFNLCATSLLLPCCFFLRAPGICTPNTATRHRAGIGAFATSTDFLCILLSPSPHSWEPSLSSYPWPTAVVHGCHRNTSKALLNHLAGSTDYQ